MGFGSSFINSFKDENGVAKWQINVGCVGNQTYAGNSCTEAGAVGLYLGSGDYEMLWKEDASVSVNLTQDLASGTYNLTKLSFGDLKLSS
jgi:hypothetical protein